MASQDDDRIAASQRAFNDKLNQMNRASTALAKAIEGVTNGALDAMEQKFLAVAKSSSLLTDEQKDLIKTVRGAQSAFEEMERLGDTADELDKAWTKATKALNASGVTGAKKRAEQAKINKRLQEGTEKLTKTYGVNASKFGSSATDMVKGVREIAKAGKDHKDQVRGLTSELSRSSAKLGKVFEKVGGYALNHGKRLIGASTALGLFEKGIEVLYNQASRLADRGMFAAMASINIGAMKLRLSAEEFEEIIKTNMHLVQTFGGGVKGIEGFTEAIQDAKGGLALYGKNANTIAVRIMDVMNMGGANPKRRNKEYMAELEKMKDQFKFLNGGFGDTIEQFAEYHGTVMQSEQTQQQLNLLDEKSKTLYRDEIRERIRALRTLGLTTDQMKELTTAMGQMPNIRKNAQAEAVTNRLKFVTGTTSMAKELDDKALADMLSRNANEVAMKLNKAGTQKQREELISNDEQVRNFVRGFAKARAELDAKKQGAEDLSVGLLANQQFEGNVIADVMGKAGDMLNAASVQGRNVHEMDGGVEEFTKRIKEASGEATALGKAFAGVRTAWDQVTSILSNPFTVAIGGAIGGLTLLSRMSTTVGGAMSKFGSGAKKLLGSTTRVLSNSISSVGKMMMSGFKGVFGSIGRFLKAIPGLSTLSAAIMTAVETFSTDTEDFYERLGMDRNQAGDSLGKDIAVRSAGALLNFGAAAAQVATFGTVDLSKDFADKERKRRESAPKDQKDIDKSATQTPRAVAPAAQAGALPMPGKDVGEAIRHASTTVGVDQGYMLAMGAQESRFNPNAKAGTSSAKGLYQFIDGTWAEMVKKYGAQYGIGMNDQYDPQKNALMGALFTRDNSNALKSSGFEATPTNLYASHFLGAGGAKQLLNAKNINGKQIAAELMPGPAKSNQNVFYNKDGSPRTIDEVYSFLDTKVGAKAQGYSGLLAQSSAPMKMPTFSAPKTVSTAPISAAAIARQQELSTGGAVNGSAVMDPMGLTPLLDVLSAQNSILEKHSSFMGQIASNTIKSPFTRPDAYQQDKQTAYTYGV